MIDGHIHVTEELQSYLKESFYLANADCPEEYCFLKESKAPGMVISVGVHPWKADITLWSEMEGILQKAAVIGEIGLDCEWCTVDLEIQRELFCRQLELASTLHKPVILHTKGMEKEILDTILQYPNRYLVHWYSCSEWLKEYIEYGCWFTVGPDVASNQAVETLARAVPADKLLIESDGLEGISWGQGRDLSAAEYMKAMEEHLQNVAKLRGESKAELLKQMEENLKNFIG